MGTDINLCVEIKGRDDDEWRPILAPNPYYDKADPESRPYSPSEMYNIRNSDLFAILAGLGNRTIGPGGDRYDKFTIISRPRGLPPDVSREVRKEYETLLTDYDGWDEEEFYISWLTIGEILAFDWNRLGEIKINVSEKNYLNLMNDRLLVRDGDIDLHKIRNISQSEMDRIISGETPREEGAFYYSLIEKDITYRKLVNPFLEFCEYLDFQFSTGSNAERGSNVRLVFWFDY